MDNEQIINKIRNELKVFESVQFDEANHSYQWVSPKTNSIVHNRLSMTTLIHKYRQPFNQEEQARIYAEKNKLDPVEVLKQWRFEAKLSTTKGTAIHNYLEYLFNNIPFDYQYDVAKVVEQFGVDVLAPHWEKLTKIANEFHDMAITFLIPIACELKIFDDETGIAGAIDLLAYHIPSKQLVILDYKSNKEIIMRNQYKQFMLPPLNHLPDINYVHYSLQLNGYQYILQKNTSLRLRNRHYLIHINEKNGKAEIIQTLDLLKYAKAMIEREDNIY